LAKIDTTQTLAPPLAAWGRLAANSTAHMVEHLFNGVIAVILPLITTALGLSLAQAGALASARTLMAGVASFPSGFFADLASRRNFFLGLCLGMIGLGFELSRFADLHGARGRWRRRFSPAVAGDFVFRLSGEARVCLGRAR
jgi:MFS family permease